MCIAEWLLTVRSTQHRRKDFQKRKKVVFVYWSLITKYCSGKKKYEQKKLSGQPKQSEIIITICNFACVALCDLFPLL